MELCQIAKLQETYHDGIHRCRPYVRARMKRTWPTTKQVRNMLMDKDKHIFIEGTFIRARYSNICLNIRCLIFYGQGQASYPTRCKLKSKALDSHRDLRSLYHACSCWQAERQLTATRIMAIYCTPVST